MSDPDALDEAAVEEAVREALAEGSSASELQPLIEALRARRRAYAAEAEQAADEADRAHWRARIAEVDRQIEALRVEEALAAFVEFSVRTAASRARPASLQDEGED